VEATLRAIYNLSRDCAENQLRFGGAEVIPLVMKSLGMHFFKPHVVYYCCLCIGGLCNNSIVNAEQFDELELGELLCKVLSMYMEQGLVVEAACYAIYALRDLNHRLGDVCKVRTG
jgi:hypothetical protein